MSGNSILTDNSHTDNRITELIQQNESFNAAFLEESSERQAQIAQRLRTLRKLNGQQADVYDRLQQASDRLRHAIRGVTK